MATSRERPKRVKVRTENIVQIWMDKPGVIMARIEDLPSDVADVVRQVDERPARRAMARQFSVGPEVGGSSVILAHFDALRREGKEHVVDFVVGTYYNEFIRPNQVRWSQEELKAQQDSPERKAQRIQDEKQASLRRYDALIEKLSD